MKIAIPVEDKSIEGNICQSFGRSPYFLIYDTGSEESVFLNNTAAASQGGAGIKAAQIIVDSRAQAVLTPRAGEKAASVLAAADIKIYKTINDSIRDNIKAFTKGRLTLLDDIHPGFHRRRG
ncbi:MAG: dinitrogenase iron-molybdenum cofactor biosynthesis protein [Syntrophomonadaceae bacterium]|jgi:predicted Fe-Mo cluster-binding NifX family protein|nr:dinitrogenase iron-molybdenum cofactor biosynthesis protein [Syntrophomonadaceae bacterium]